MLKKDEKNIMESSRSVISGPPDPFESLNNNHNNQMMNSSEQISDTNTINNENIKNKEVLGNIGINIGFKEKYKEQLSQLKDMGFNNEESNIQALKHSNGNINNALEKLLEKN